MGRLNSIRRKTSSAIGAITVLCGFLMMWGSTMGVKQQNSTQANLRAQAVLIDPLIPQATNNGAVVVGAAKLSSQELLEDEFLKPGPFLILRRRVEMFQWKEERNPIGSSTNYSVGWHEGQIDFFSFKQPTGHENPLLRYQSFTRVVDSAAFGGFDAREILQALRVLIPLKLESKHLKDTSWRIEDNKIVIPRGVASLDGPSLGDMRVWYEVIPQGPYTIMARQVDERNLLGSGSSEAMVLRPGELSIDELFAVEDAATTQTSDGLLFVGGGIFFIGLFSVLLPMAERINLRPRIELEGVAAVGVVSAVIAGAAVFVFFVLGRLG